MIFTTSTRSEPHRKHRSSYWTLIYEVFYSVSYWLFKQNGTVRICGCDTVPHFSVLLLLLMVLVSRTTVIVYIYFMDSIFTSAKLPLGDIKALLYYNLLCLLSGSKCLVTIHREREWSFCYDLLYASGSEQQP